MKHFCPVFSTDSCGHRTCKNGQQIVSLSFVRSRAARWFLDLELTCDDVRIIQDSDTIERRRLALDALVEIGERFGTGVSNFYDRDKLFRHARFPYAGVPPFFTSPNGSTAASELIDLALQVESVPLRDPGLIVVSAGWAIQHLTGNVSELWISQKQENIATVSGFVEIAVQRTKTKGVLQRTRDAI